MRYKSTIGMTEADWQQEHFNYIGGSSVPAILEHNPWETPYDIWLTYINRIIKPENENMKSGKRQEAVIAEWFEEQFKCHVQNDNKIWYHPKYPFLGANIDRKINVPELGPGILEGKSTRKSTFKKYSDPTLEIPLYYYDQVQFYLWLLKARFAYVAVQLDIREYFAKYIEPNRAWQKESIPKVISFWTENIQKRIPPPPSNTDDIMKLYPNAKEGESIHAWDAMLEAVERRKKIDEDIAVLEDEKEHVNNSIMLAMREAESVVYAGEEIVTWKPDKNGTRKLRVKGV